MVNYFAGKLIAMLQCNARHSDRWVRVSFRYGIKLSHTGQCVRPAIFKHGK